MISAKGLTPPVVLPGAVGVAGQDLDLLVTVLIPLPPRSETLGVDIVTPSGATQQPVDGAPLALETVVAPHRCLASFLPAGTAQLPNGDPLPAGALERDAWAIEAVVGELRADLPAEFPLPVLWLLEGVDAASVAAVLETWLAGGVTGVVPQPDRAHDTATDPERGATAQDTWRTRMLGGTWSELVEAEVVLGQASVMAGNPTLWVRTFDENGTEVPAAAVLEVLAGVDPVFMAGHPVVVQAAALAANLPVRMVLRFDAWDVDLASADDAKGAVRFLAPTAVRLVADDGGPAIGDLQLTWADPHTVAEIDRAQLEGRSFHVEVDFPPDTRIRLVRGQESFWPDPDQPPSWSTAGWEAKDGTATGSWRQFTGVQIGTETAPAAFWVGTRVRLVVEYQQWARNMVEQKQGTTVQTVRVAPGHEVGLCFAVGDLDFHDQFVTDQDGEVSAVSFGVSAGDRVGVAVRRSLTVGEFDELLLEVVDEPDERYEDRNGSESASGRPPLVFVDDFGYFWSEEGREPLLRSPFTSGDLSGTVRVDADGSDPARGNTGSAAAFHALKYALFTHEALVLVKGSNDAMPSHHQFHVVNEDGDAHTVSFQVGGSWLAPTYLPSSNWFERGTEIHEYAHAAVRSLSNTLGDPGRREPYVTGVVTFSLRFLQEREQEVVWHNPELVTNGGMALSEGLAELVELLFGAGVGLPVAGAQSVPAGEEGWARHRYLVDTPIPGQPAGSYDGEPHPLRECSGRNVEGVFAGAMHQYLTDVTGLPGLGSVGDDTGSGYKRPQAYLDEWLGGRADPATALVQLHRMAAWLLVDPLEAVVGDSFWYTGHWPEPSGDRYPTVYDYLRRIEREAPIGAADPKESFAHLHDRYLLPWHLEREPAPGLGQDWTP